MKCHLHKSWWGCQVDVAASNLRVTTPPTLTGPPGLFNNTLVIYILGDNGASAEGFHGTIDELLTENSLPNTAKQQIEVVG